MILDTECLTLSPIKEGTQEENDLVLTKTTFESIEWPGADDVPVQAWLVKPRDFDSKKQYPLLYCIHGGPNAAFNNVWASGYWRNWKFVLLAEQGFVVVAPNASGSSSFGP
jgi:dipeptidyl aminopeptidase/acylaminoacyl peptidase